MGLPRLWKNGYRRSRTEGPLSKAFWVGNRGGPLNVEGKMILTGFSPPIKTIGQKAGGTGKAKQPKADLAPRRQARREKKQI